MQFLLLIVFLLVPLVVLCSAHSTGEAACAAPPLPQELARLAAWVGTWEAEVTLMGATSKGSETCRLECGGTWLATDFTGSFQGQPFLGKGLTGWDASKNAYAGVWVDSAGSPLSVFADGTFSPDGASFCAHVEGLGLDGKPARFEYLTTFPDARTRTFEIFQVDGGKRALQMKIRYTKRA